MKSTSNLILHHILWRGLYFFSILLLNIGIARFFAAEKSGHIFYIVNNLSLLLLLVSISLESGSAYYIASGQLDASRMARFCLLWAAAGSLVGIAIWCIMLYFTRPLYIRDLGFVFSSFGFILGVLLTTYFTALFYAKKQFGLPNKILFAVNMVLVAMILLGKNGVFFRAHFISVYFSFFFLQGILLMIFFFMQKNQVSDSFFPSRSVLVKVIRYSLAALLANAVYFGVNRIDYWFVQYFCSGNDLGNYIQASKLAQLLLILPAILGSTLFPIFSSGDSSVNGDQLTQSMRLLLWINAGCCLVILGTGWFLFPMLFGPSFGKMYSLFCWLVPGILCVSLNYPLTAWFSANKRIGVNIRGSVMALLVICLGDLIGLPRWGVMVAPVVSSAGYIVYFVYTICLYRKEFALPMKSFLLVRSSDIRWLDHALGRKSKAPLSENTLPPKIAP
jgi:O-antigen/teichoic acid export membrane protein